MALRKVTLGRSKNIDQNPPVWWVFFSWARQRKWDRRFGTVVSLVRALKFSNEVLILTNISNRIHSRTRLSLVGKYECIKSKSLPDWIHHANVRHFAKTQFRETNEHDVWSLDDGLRVSSTEIFIPAISTSLLLSCRSEQYCIFRSDQRQSKEE